LNEVNKNMYNTNGFLVVLFCIRIQVTLKLNYQWVLRLHYPIAK